MRATGVIELVAKYYYIYLSVVYQFSSWNMNHVKDVAFVSQIHKLINEVFSLTMSTSLYLCEIFKMYKKGTYFSFK